MFTPQEPVCIARKSVDPQHEQSKRQRLKNFTEEFVFEHVLEKYWGMQFRDHLQNKKDVDTQGNTLFSDCFSITFDGTELSVICVIPQNRCAWDIILACYHLYFPNQFPSTEHVAKALFNKLSGFDMNCKFILNFDETAQMKYLNGMFDENVPLEGGNFNWYLTDPLACVWAYMRSEMLISQKLSGTETEEQINRFSQIQRELEPEKPILREKLDAQYAELKQLCKKYKVLNKIE